VLATASTGQTSEPSDQGNSSLLRVAAARACLLRSGSRVVGWQYYLIRGRAEPGTTIRIAGRETITQADGSFQMQVTAPSGARDITIDAEDQRGNSTPITCRLSGPPGPRERLMTQAEADR